MGMDLRDRKTQRLVFGTLIAVTVLYVNFFTAIVPFTYKAGAVEVKDLSDRYQELSHDLTKAKQAVTSLPYLQKEYDLLHGKWEKAQLLLPDKEEMAPLLRAVTLLGDRSDVEFVLFRPLPEQPAQYYTEHPVEVKVEGGYHEIGSFLAELANMERIMTISDLSITPPRDSPNHRSASASFIAKTYTLGGTGVPPEDQVAPGGKTVSGGTKRSGVGTPIHAAKEMGKKLKAKQRGAPDNE